MVKLTMIAAAAALAMLGCAGSPSKTDPLNQSELLALSGFTMKIAVSQEDLDQLGGIPQQTLLRVASSSQPLYIWADAAGCRCYYVGGEEAYRRLEAMGMAAARD
jgi:hypothetical protein